ncbi:MAG: potassium transporter [Lentisphaerae bacterium]|nr:potassium transporter [Lentisphaerota bacterium]MCP4100371.1 potassium transporter [Lentisphaerota bacterium]
MKKSQLYFIFSFVGVIIIGTVLLKMPFVTHTSGPLSWIDALFTSTSAVCVTGLTTVNTSGFNMTGQMIIITLIQIGGLGIMTLTASIVILLGRGMSFTNTLLFSNLSDSFPLKSMESLLVTVLTYTFVIESAGFLLLTYGFLEVNGYSLMEASYLAMFHSVSAFCNAGFSTYDTSLVTLSPFIQVVIALLIILGGLGVYVIFELTHYSKVHFLRIHTRLVLITTGFLIVGGAILIKALEYFEGGRIDWLGAFFQSVTARTAGFNSVDLSLLHPASIMIIIALMLIGASPGGTGGGMKTTTFALVFMSIMNTFKGSSRVLLFKREIPQSNILKAYTIMFTFILLSVASAIVVSATTGASLQDSFFEVASALGTVGLSLGVTAKGGVVCKIVLILCMFVGRIGPFTMFLFLLGKEKTSRLEYPEERVIMG